MKFIRFLIIFFVVFVATILIVGYSAPKKVKYSQSKLIAYPAKSIFPLVNSMKGWKAWYPLLLQDTSTKFVFSGAESGVHSIMTWDSEKRKVGSGAMEIVESKPDSFLSIKLSMANMNARSISFTLQPKDSTSTLVTWSMESDMGSDPFSRIFGYFIPGLLKGDFTKGLHNLEHAILTAPVSTRP